MNQRKKWKVLSLALMLIGTLTFYGCQKGLVEGDEGSTETHVEGESTQSGLVQVVDLSAYTLPSLNGVVTDDLGYPLSGASVSAAGQSTTTASSGLYTLTNIPIAQAVSSDATITAGANNASLGTIPVSVSCTAAGGCNAGDATSTIDYTTAVVYVGSHAVVSDSAQEVGASNAPNTVVLTSLSADSGDVALKRLAATVRGKVRDGSTLRAVSGVEITLVPVDNNVSNVTGVPGAAGTHNAGEVTWGHKAASLVVTTSSDGTYSFSNIAVSTFYDVFVTSNTYTGSGSVVTGRSASRAVAAVTGNTLTSTSQCASSVTSRPSNCLGTVSTAAGITEMPILTVLPSTSSVAGDQTNPQIITVSGAAGAVADGSTFTDTDSMLQLEEGNFARGASDESAPSALTLTFSEPLDSSMSSRFNVVSGVTGKVVSVTVTDAAGNSYTLDSSTTALDTTAGTLTLSLSGSGTTNTNDVITPGTGLKIRLRADHFEDTNGNQLTVSTTVNTYNAHFNCSSTLGTSGSDSDCIQANATSNNNPTGTSETQGNGVTEVNTTGYVTLYLRTFKELSVTVTAAVSDLAQATYSSSLSNQESYTGLYKYAAPSTVTEGNADVNGNGNSTDTLVGFYTASDISANIFQLNPNATGTGRRSLAYIATTLEDGTAHTVATNFAQLTFTAVSGKSYRVTIKDSTSTALTISDTNVVAGSSVTTALTLSDTGSGYGTFTANGTAMNIWISGAGASYTVNVNPLNDFGDPVPASGQTVTLADNVPPMVAIQEDTLANESDEAFTKAGSATTSTSSSSQTGGSQVVSASSTLGYPVYPLRGSFYNTSRTSTAAATKSLLGGSTRYYAAADYTSWSARATDFVVNMTESLDTSTVSAATVRGNSNTSSSLAHTTLGITSLSFPSTTYLQAQLGDWRTIAHLAFMDITGLKDSAGNAADSTTGLIFTDRAPAIVKSLKTTGNVLEIALDQQINSAWSTSSSYPDGTTILSVTANGVGIGSTVTTYDLVTETNSSASSTGLLLRRTQGDNHPFQDAYEVNISSGQDLLVDTATVAYSAGIGTTLTITVTGTTVNTSSNTQASSGAKIAKLFGDVSYNTSSTVASTQSWASYDNLRDSNNNTWAGISNTQDSYITVSSVQQTPRIFPQDATPPKIASTGLPITTSGCATTTCTVGTVPVSRTMGIIHDGSYASGGGNRVALSIAHTGYHHTAIGTFVINATTAAGGLNEGLWQIGDSTGSSATETYNIAIQFNEAIWCGTSCTGTMTSTASSAYNTPTVKVVKSLSNSTSITSSESSNTLHVSFQLQSSKSVSSADTIAIAGVADLSGNTMPTFTISLATTPNGIVVSPTSAFY